MNGAHTHCHRCGETYGSEAWPRSCPACGNLQWHNPTPIGVLMQPVVGSDGRVGVLTPIRGQDPMRGHPALTGGFQEAADMSSEDAGAREFHEEIGLPRPREEDVRIFASRSTGPMVAGRRQNLVFSYSLHPLPLAAFDAFVPDAETLAIEVSWAPRPLAFPSHSWAMARFFVEKLGIQAPPHLLRQPRTGDAVRTAAGTATVHDVPYAQPMLELGVWVAILDEGAPPVALDVDGGGWTLA